MGGQTPGSMSLDAYGIAAAVLALISRLKRHGVSPRTTKDWSPVDICAATRRHSLVLQLA